MHKHAITCMHHPLATHASEPPKIVGYGPRGREGGGARGGCPALPRPPRAGAREAREERGGASKVVAVRCEEARAWDRVLLVCAGPASEGRKRT